MTVIELKENEANFVINLIEVIASRGALKGDELLAVGQLREVIVERLKDVKTEEV